MLENDDHIIKAVSGGKNRTGAQWAIFKLFAQWVKF
jgi:hypothetical protein